MTRAGRAVLVSATLLAGCGTTDPVDVDLTGTWQADVNALEIRAMTLSLVERDHDITGTGQWTPVAGGGPSDLTAAGLHFGADIALTLTLSTGAGRFDLGTEGRVEDENSFHLVFPTAGNPVRALFRRR